MSDQIPISEIQMENLMSFRMQSHTSNRPLQGASRYQGVRHLRHHTDDCNTSPESTQVVSMAACRQHITCPHYRLPSAEPGHFAYRYPQNASIGGVPTGELLLLSTLARRADPGTRTHVDNGTGSGVRTTADQLRRAPFSQEQVRADVAGRHYALLPFVATQFRVGVSWSRAVQCLRHANECGVHDIRSRTDWHDAVDFIALYRSIAA